MAPPPRLALLLASLLAAAMPVSAQTAAVAQHDVAPAEAAPLMPRYLLMDVQGRAVSQEDFRGRFQLVTFGFISCPDVCPTALSALAEAMRRLGPDAANCFTGTTHD